MFSNLPSCQRPRLGAAAKWVNTALVSLGLMFASAATFAAPPPANTIIGNQASAAYTDPNGLPQTATSNLVQTTVQQVGAFTLDGQTTVTTTVVNTKTGASGATVYAPHVLTNTGNGADGFNITVDTAAGGFSKVEVFADANGDGVPDGTTPLCTAVPAAACTVPTQTVAGSNGQFQFVVAYSIPSTATTPTTPYAFGTVTATVSPASPALATYASTQAADRDNVNLTTLAAFNLTKGVTVPASGVTAPGGGAWPAAPVTGVRSSSASCPTTYVAGMSSTASCQYTVYTLQFSNTGGAAGQFHFTDTLPAGFTYVAGSAVWSNAPGVALPQAGMQFAATGNVLEGIVTTLPVNTSQSVSFVVLVNSSATLGTTSTTNTALYSPLSDPSALGNTANVTSPSNPAAFTVKGSYGVVLGSAASTAATALDATSPGTPNAGAADTTTVATAAAGAQVPFTQVVYNTGNATDTVNITGASTGTGGGTAFPAGTTFSYFKADGSTPLSDTNGDGIVDTGVIPAGGALTIVVRANLPNALAPAAGPLGYTLTVTGTSVGDPARVDATRDVLNALTGVLVDLTNSQAGTTGPAGDIGTGPSTAPTTTNTVAAGATTVFPLFIANGDSVSNSYALAAGSTASMGPLPAGWTVKFVAGSVTAASCAAAPAITTVGPIAAATLAPATPNVTACVTPPVSQAGVTAQPIYFQVRSTAAASTGSVVVDTKYDAVTVTPAAATYGATLTPNNVGQVAPGGSIVYAHTLTNTGTASCAGPYTLAATLPPADVTAGWTTALYIDVNGDGQIDGGDTLVTGPIAGPLAVAGTQKLLVKVFAPGGAQAGASDTASVTITFPAGATSCGTPSATDISTVITGQIRLVKTQYLNAAVGGVCPAVPAAAAFSAAPITTARPGDCIVYQITATNQGAAPVTNMTINDAVPAWTSLTGATQPATQCVQGAGVSGTPLAYSASGSAVSCGSAANTVQPGASATLSFAVKVNP